MLLYCNNIFTCMFIHQVTHPLRFQSDYHVHQLMQISAVGTHYNSDWKLSLFSTKLTGTIFIQGYACLCVSFKRLGLSRDLKDSVTAIVIDL